MEGCSLTGFLASWLTPSLPRPAADGFFRHGSHRCCWKSLGHIQAATGRFVLRQIRIAVSSPIAAWTTQTTD